MPYQQGPYSTFASLTAPTTTKITGSRKVDFTTGRYELDSSGNHKGMDPTAQRVVLAVSFAAPIDGSIDDEQALEQRRKAVFTVLEPLEREGAIRVESVTIERTAGGELEERIRYRNLLNEQESTLKRTHG